jgi:hypothetical protein
MKIDSLLLLFAEITAKFTFGGFYQAICRREGDLILRKLFYHFFVDYRERYPEDCIPRINGYGWQVL